jgi:Phage tail assembly chaperone protein
MEVTTFARVDPDTLEVTLSYNTNGGDRWAPDDLECPFPFDVLADHAVRADDGTITLQEDPQKVNDHKATLWSQLRTQRDTLLAASDWRVLPYSPLTSEEQAAWVTYRQALRDLPGSVQDPLNPVWPPVPSP